MATPKNFWVTVDDAGMCVLWHGWKKYLKKNSAFGGGSGQDWYPCYPGPDHSLINCVLGSYSSDRAQSEWFFDGTPEFFDRARKSPQQIRLVMVDA